MKGITALWVLNLVVWFSLLYFIHVNLNQNWSFTSVISTIRIIMDVWFLEVWVFIISNIMFVAYLTFKFLNREARKKWPSQFS